MTKKKLLIIISLIILVATGLTWAFRYNFKKLTGQPTTPAQAAEIVQIKATTNLITQVKLYKQLIERVGAIQAQEDLFSSGLPFTGQTHLLNHTTGEYLYQKYGATGLSLCKEYFLASCYHGFILNAIATGGIPEVGRVLDDCRVQGPAVFPQCVHAVGHGFLADVGYKNLTQALKLCDQMVATVPDFTTFNCYDGIFMENIWAVHEGGEPSPDRWVKESDHNYPCSDKRIDPKYLLGCWSNQPALAYQQFRGQIPPVADLCSKVTPANLKEMCYNGLSRQIHPLTGGQINKVFQLCEMVGKDWENYCILTNASAFFSVGDRIIPFQICARIDAGRKDQCYERLVGMIGVYAKTPSDRTDWCGKIDNATWRNRCLKS